VLSEISALK